MTSAIQNEDRLSTLPEELLSNILSLMPTISAVRTCILSKRWRYSWTLIHNFDFDCMYNTYGKDGWSRFVERVFVHCRPPELNLFRSHFPQSFIYSLAEWIDRAVRLNVREVDISADYLDLPSSLFVCRTLTKLRLDCSFYHTDGLWNHSCSVNLPCLNTLDLATNYVSADTLKLIRGCQVLESLSLKVCEIVDTNEDIILDIPTLKILKLTLPTQKLKNHTFDLNMPNLEYLSIDGKLCSQFVMAVPSLVKVSVSFINIGHLYTHLCVKLLKGISGVKSLSWSCSRSTNHILYDSALPIFPNLKSLYLKNFPGQLPISRLLERSPELEHLNIETPEGSCWIEFNLPSCKLMNLKTIKLKKTTVRVCDIWFLKYMLENAKGLKTLTITCDRRCPTDERILCEKLATFQRASTNCEIHFFGYQFSSTII